MSREGCRFLTVAKYGHCRRHEGAKGQLLPLGMTWSEQATERIGFRRPLDLIPMEIVRYPNPSPNLATVLPVFVRQSLRGGRSEVPHVLKVPFVFGSGLLEVTRFEQDFEDSRSTTTINQLPLGSGAEHSMWGSPPPHNG